MEAYTRSEQTKSLPQGGEIQNGDTGNHQNIPPTRGVGDLNRLQGRLLPYTNTGTVQEIFHVQGQTYQFKALRFGLSTVPLEFTVVAKEVKLMAIHKGIRIHQFLDDWLVRARSHQVCLQHTQDLVKICQKLGWLVNLEKPELEPKQIFDIVGYQFDLRAGWVRPTPDRWQNLQDKILEMLSLPVCPVWQFMSLIGLLTATEKQVHLGRLHMRPIQWHLKTTGKGDFNSQVPAPSFTMVARRRQCPHRLTIAPNKTCSANLYRCIKRRVGRSLKLTHCKRNLVPLESKLHINYLELKAVFLALKEFQDLCLDKIVLVATDNTTVVSYINKEGGMRSGPLCALLWRILTWCTRNQVTLKAQHIPGWLNVVADKLSRLCQTIQTEWSLLPEVFQATCSRWHRPQRGSTTSCLCFTGTGSLGYSSGCFPTSSHFGKSGGEVAGLPMQENHSDCSGVAKHALVLGPSGHVQSNPTEPAQSTQPVDTTLQLDPSQESDRPKSPCMAPRASAFKEQGFSEAVAQYH